MLPFELYYQDLDRASEAMLGEIKRLIGLPQESELGDVRRVMSRLNRLWDRRCLRIGEYKECVLLYKKSLRAPDYLERPIVSAARGAVIRHYTDGTAKQLAMPFAKFFNYRECRLCSRIPEGESIVSEKLDGTLIVAYRDPESGEILFSTRGSLHRPPIAVNPYVERFIASIRRLGLWEVLEDIVKDKTTVMFELVNRGCPASFCLGRELETPPGDDRWIPFLLARRDHGSMGLDYMTWSHDFSRPRMASAGPQDLESLVRRIGGEGVVAYYPGHYYLGFKWWSYMLKLKNKSYVMRSLASAAEVSEEARRGMYKRIARLVTTGRIDDLRPYLSGDLARFADEYQEAYIKLVEAYEDLAGALKAAVDRIGLGKVRNILKNNLHQQDIAENIELIIENPERAASKAVREKLIGKPKPELMIDSIRRYTRRIRGLKHYITEASATES